MGINSSAKAKKVKNFMGLKFHWKSSGELKYETRTIIIVNNDHIKNEKKIRFQSIFSLAVVRLVKVWFCMIFTQKNKTNKPIESGKIIIIKVPFIPKSVMLCFIMVFGSKFNETVII